jgi:predicted alpha/beta superfamily hydrolase
MAANSRLGAEYIPDVQTHIVSSTSVGQPFKVQVMQPAMKRGETARFPVVYVTDGNFAFDALKGIAYSIQMLERDAPRFILVGIGYPGESPKAGSLLRCRDFTFPGYPRFSLDPPPVEGVLTAPHGTKDYDGAQEFQGFIGDELIPFIDEKYPTIAGDRAYFGHSAGGGFGLFTMLTKPELFRRYILSSPATVYDGETTAGVKYQNYDFLLQRAREFLAAGKSFGDIRLYLSVGTEEEFEEGLREWQLTSSFYRLANLLRLSDVPGLQMTAEAFQGETHLTVWPMAFIHGIQSVFGTRTSSGKVLKPESQNL